MKFIEILIALKYIIISVNAGTILWKDAYPLGQVWLDSISANTVTACENGCKANSLCKFYTSNNGAICYLYEALNSNNN